MNPTCPYCNNKSAQVTGQKIYPHRKDLYSKWFYVCEPCDAYVGCHPGGDKPLGRLANSGLRLAKRHTHAAFDPLWRDGPMSRRQAYKWLSGQLSIPPEDTHIGMFDIDRCVVAIRLCEAKQTQLKLKQEAKKNA